MLSTVPRRSDEAGAVVDDLLDVLRRAVAPRFEVLKLMGLDELAQVYLAEDRRHGSRVAVKLLRPDRDGDAAHRLQQIVELAARIEHEGVVAPEAAGQPHGLPYYILPYVHAESLRDVLRRSERLPVERVLAMVSGAARVLAGGHRRDAAHRDIKPETIRLMPDDAIVIECGAADTMHTDPERRQGRSSNVVGTPEYVSPEQARGAPRDARSDVYSLACVAYEMLAGTPPFRGTPGAVLAKHQAAAPTPLSQLCFGLPPAMSQAVQRGLAKDPNERFPSSGDFAAALNVAWRAAGARLGASVAVLPVVNLSLTASLNRTGERATQSIVHELVYTHHVSVQRRTAASLRQFDAVHIRELGRRLGVEGIVLGHVREVRGEGQMTLTLLDAAGRRLWSHHEAWSPASSSAPARLGAECARALARAVTNAASAACREAWGPAPGSSRGGTNDQSR